MTLVIYLSVLCLFVCFYLRSLKNVQCYLHFRSEELVFRVKTYSFVLPSCNGRVVWGLNYPFLRCNHIIVRWNTLTSRRHSLLSSSHEKKAVDCHYLLFLCVSNTIETIGIRIVVVVVVVDNHACALSCADVFCVLRS